MSGRNYKQSQYFMLYFIIQKKLCLLNALFKYIMHSDSAFNIGHVNRYHGKTSTVFHTFVEIIKLIIVHVADYRLKK